MYTLEPTLGLPPGNDFSYFMVENSMPIIEIMPAIPSFSKGLTLFSADTNTGGKEYTKSLKKFGYEFPFNTEKLPIKIAFQADSFPSDSFSNDYGESFIAKAANVASGGLAELNYMFGGSSATQTLSNLAKVIKGTGGTMETVVGAIESGTSKFKNSMSNISKGHENLRGLGDMANKLLGGQRIDFPQVWKGSAFAPSYDLTVRLYNPNAKNDEYHERFIVGPLVALLLLVLPRGGGSSYTYPFLIKGICHGLFELNPGFIGSVSVVKGGDQMSISYNQRPSVIDVRLTMGGLYSVMTDGGGGYTLKSYIDRIKGKKTVMPVHSTLPPIIQEDEDDILQQGVTTSLSQESENQNDIDPRNSAANLARAAGLQQPA